MLWGGLVSVSWKAVCLVVRRQSSGRGTARTAVFEAKFKVSRFALAVARHSRSASSGHRLALRRVKGVSDAGPRLRAARNLCKLPGSSLMECKHTRKITCLAISLPRAPYGDAGFPPAGCRAARSSL